MESETTIPLFPLGVVLLPTMILPLHIFEERYKLMISECIVQDKEFGIVYTDDNETREKGCTAKTIKVIKRYDDGRMDILTQGEQRFVIRRLIDDKAYLQASVVYFDDADDRKTEELNKLVGVGLGLLGELDGLVGKSTDYSFTSDFDLKTISFLIAYNDAFTPVEKQGFLEMTSSRKRIIQSVELLGKKIELAKISQEIKRITGGNGDIRKGIPEVSLQE